MNDRSVAALERAQAALAIEAEGWELSRFNDPRFVARRDVRRSRQPEDVSVQYESALTFEKLLDRVVARNRSIDAQRRAHSRRADSTVEAAQEAVNLLEKAGA